MAPAEVPPPLPWSRRLHWWTLGTGIVVVLVSLGLLLTSWNSLVHAHPAHLVTLLLVLAVGLVLVVAGFRPMDPEEGRSRWRWVGRAALVVVAVAVLGVLVWLRPLPADPVAVAALRSDAAVTVDESWTKITMTPASNPKSTALVFYPGAKVDPRAYAHILRPVAEAGYPVTILKLPYNIAFVSPNAAGSVVGPSETVDHWVVAGHSLGGVTAARFASRNDDEVDGLVLWASFPAGDISAAGVEVLSVSGTADGLTTPDDVERSKQKLPGDTQFVAVDGAVHAFFGDYGPQSGDGEPTVTREEAQAQIVAATIAFLAQVDAAGT